MNLPVSKNTIDFRNRFYPEATDRQWQSWKWQLSHRINSVEKLRHIIDLDDSEAQAFTKIDQRLPFAITPFYMGVVKLGNPDGVLRKTLIPVLDEFIRQPNESLDPLTETAHSPVPAIVHRYPDRVLFLATSQCAVYCRYCTRARIFSQGSPGIDHRRDWQQGLDYIAADPNIREVIVSGGDPLVLKDGLLGELLEAIRNISHVQIIRLGTKLPVVLPQRITTEFVDMLNRFHPLIVSLHVNHPNELTMESIAAIGRLADAGVMMGSQTVLLKGVNDQSKLIRELMEKLLKYRIRPYALFQCDPIIGSGHFRTSLEKGIEILADLRRQTSGYAIPQFIADPPGGKVALAPETLISKSRGRYRLRNWKGEEIEYTDPPP